MNLVFFSNPFSTQISALWLIGIGTLLFVLGLFHQRPGLARWDMHAFQFLHDPLQRYSRFFRFIWPLGTTPVCMVLLAIIYLAGWQVGLMATLMYLVAAIIEGTTKRITHRPRPFELLSDVPVLQPTPPQDPSHPSGDALRVWFLALTFPFAFGILWPVTLLTCSIAVILSLGRIALGVHYPLDVIGGAGLGILSAGLTMISYHISIFS